MKEFLLIGLETYLGSSSRDIYRFFRAPSQKEAKERIRNKRSIDDNGTPMGYLQNKRLFQKITLSK